MEGNLQSYHKSLSSVTGGALTTEMIKLSKVFVDGRILQHYVVVRTINLAYSLGTTVLVLCTGTIVNQLDLNQLNYPSINWWEGRVSSNTRP